MTDASLSSHPDWPAVDDDAPTTRFVRASFCGIEVPRWPADVAIPPRPVAQEDISTWTGEP